MVFHTLMQSIIQFLVPAACLFCGLSRGSDICSNCQQWLPILPHSCYQCARSLPASSSQPALCGHCLTSPPPIERTIAGFPYQAPIGYCITALKFKQQLAYASALGRLFAEKIQRQNQPLPDILLPVPLHPKRLKERGFNQALEIARPLSKRLGVAIDHAGVRRIRHTEAQSSLRASRRKQNMQAAFLVHHDYSQARIAIIDDVMTTGSTVYALAEALRQAGASHIEVWCLARRY